MSFPAQILDKQKVNQMQKCFYLMNLIRNKNMDLWEMYAPVFETLKPEESWEFSEVLVKEYQSLLDAPPAPKKKTTAKKRAPAAKKKVSTKK